LLHSMVAKYIVSLIIFLAVAPSAKGSDIDSLSTKYTDGQFVTYCQVKVKVPPEIMNDVANDYVYQLKYDLNKLFTWALKGMKLRKENDAMMVFNLKSTAFDESNNILKATGAVDVTGIISFPEIHVDSRLTKTEQNGHISVHLEMLDADAFLKKTIGIFQVIPQKNECTIVLTTYIKFGWFFNIFVTKNIFKKIMEWRFQKMMHNIANEAINRDRIRTYELQTKK